MTTTDGTTSLTDNQELSSVAEAPPALPDPQVQPTMTVPQAGRYLGLQKAASYNAARRGEIPTISVGRRLLVPTAKLRALLGIDTATTDAAA
ncbi:helix-turn-helix domain-containing protein [Kitasatospora purpeofusca]|uniref:helix-turn-helix domain-containing protein n=1 Tax=Kitasatospora purpeofusca TaxID=67352 RepID=UPI0035DA179D